jgi:hypothetical protein
MALPDAIVGSTHTGLTITWTHPDGTPHDLTGATLTGRIYDPLTGGRAITGTLTVTGAATGEFTWAFGVADVATASDWLLVQFIATYSSDTKADKTYEQAWKVKAAL